MTSFIDVRAYRMARKKPVAYTYWPPFYRRALYFGFGVFLIMVMMGVMWSELRTVSEGISTSVYVFLSLMLGCGVGLILSALRFRLTLTSGELTLHRALYTRTLRRKEIAGYRIVSPPQGGTQNLLYLHTSGRKRPAMIVSLELEDNGPVLSWIEGIPYLPLR